MSVLGEAVVRIGADLAGLEDAMKRVQQTVSQAGAKLKSAFMADDVVASSQKLAIAVGAVAIGLGAFSFASVKAAGEMEQTRVAFDTMLGSATASKAFIAQLQAFAASTPFEFKGLTQASKQMLALGFNVQDIIPMMTNLGDAASGLSLGEEGINRMVHALGKMKTSGKANAESMMLLTEAGLNGWQYLADAAHKSVAQIQDDMSKGLISGEGAVAAIMKGIEGSNLHGMMEKQSHTLLGIWSNLMDGIGQTMTALGEKIIDALPLKDLLIAASGWLSDFATFVSAVGIREAFARMVPPELEMMLYAVAGAIAVALIPSLIAAAIALWGVIAPILPLLAIGAALGLLAYVVVKSWQPLAAFFVALWKVIRSAFMTGVGGVHVLLLELELGFAKTLNFMYGNVARFVAGIARTFSFLKNVPGLGAFIDGVETAANNVSGMFQSFEDGTARGLDAAKTSLAATAAETGSAWNEMAAAAGKAGQSIVDNAPDLAKIGSKFDLHAEAEKLRKLPDGLANNPNAQKAPPLYKAIEDGAKKAGKATGQLKDLIFAFNDKGLIAARRAFESSTSLGDVRGQQVSLAIMEAAGAAPNHFGGAGQANLVHSGTIRVEGVNDRGQLTGVTAVVADELLKGQDRFSTAPSRRRVFK